MRLYLLGLSLLLFLSSSPLSAQPTPSKNTPNDRQRAAALYEEAEARYKQKDYAAALAGYQESYQLSKEPSLLFLIGQCFRKLERFPEALESYRAYLEEEPSSSLRPQIERLIRDIEARTSAKSSPAESLPVYSAEGGALPHSLPAVIAPSEGDLPGKRRARALFRVAAAEAAVTLVLGGASLACGIKASSLGRISLTEEPDAARVKRWSDLNRSFGLAADVFLAGTLISAGIGYLEHRKAKRLDVSVSPWGALLVGHF